MSSLAARFSLSSLSESILDEDREETKSVRQAGKAQVGQVSSELEFLKED